MSKSRQDSNGQDRIPSGIVGLDRIFGGGFPKGTFCSIQGDIGTGTTTFCIRVVWSRLVDGGLAAYVCFDETPKRVVEHFKSFGYDVEPYVEKNRLLLQEGYPLLNLLASATQGQNGVAERRTLLKEFLEKYSKRTCDPRRPNESICLPAVTVIDSFSSIAPYVDLKSAYVLAHLIANSARKHGNLVLAIVHTGAIEANMLCASNAAADGIIRFERRLARGALKRLMLIEKMAFTATPSEAIEFTITSEQGVEVLHKPRSQITSEREGITA